MRELKFRFVVADPLGEEPAKLYYPSDKTDMAWGFLDYGFESAEQWTGLVDRNGKEIYEGDILQCIKGKVKALDGQKYIVGEEGGAFWVDAEQWGYGLDIDPMCTRPISKQYEIIGNIHENHDLLDADTSKHHE